ncbi:hypothetical protein RND81_07G105700 [Saponaria officinalis]
MSSPGDWLCGACQHVNFKKRESCQKCNFPKFGTQDEIQYYVCTNASSRTSDALAGDWYCRSISCGAHNYASRAICFRCGNYRSDFGSIGFGSADQQQQEQQQQQQQQQLLPGWKAGDWICVRPGCGLHNYACRMECYKCRTPKDFG